MRLARSSVVMALTGFLAVGCLGCSATAVDHALPAVAPAGPATSPQVTATPAGIVRPLIAKAQAAVFDAGTSSLVIVGTEGHWPATVTIVGPSADPPRTVMLTAPAAALAGDGRGTVDLATRGGYFRVDVAAGSVSLVLVAGHHDTEFTAIARRTDGRLVLGSADGAVYTLGSDTEVAAEVRISGRVDALVAQANTAVMLDRGQTSVTTIDASGTRAAQALRAGDGATTLAADSAGRVLVADTRGDALLVYGTDPLILRQRYPVRRAPYGLAGGRTLTWVSETAANLVIGYDLATGIPMEKVRYPTVRQPNVLAVDDATDTLFVVSGVGEGVQVINDASRHR